jgi:predicted O-methyltransferase YrrM
MLNDKILRRIFGHFYRSRLNEMLAPDYAVVLDYPIKVSPRYGYGKPPHPQISQILETGRTEFATRLTSFCKLKEFLSEIPDEPPTSRIEPCWGPQRFFSSLDAVALYGMLVEFQPKRLIEVGSGYSTKFARRAIQNHGLATHITSLDPEPRAEIDQICNRVIRKPLEDVDLALFDELESGDFLFIDSSHRTFTNSDVTIVFMELLPRLRSGVVVHIHDIFWPNDYPPEWNDRYYSEQYLLAAYLLGAGASGVKILMPNAYIVHDRDLAEYCKPLLEIAGFCRSRENVSSPNGFGGGSFWMQITAGR